jgi:hypothetical protein
MATESANTSNWLIKAGELADEAVLYIYPCSPLTQETAQAALEAQYGAGVYDAWQHGQALRVIRGGIYRNGATSKQLSKDVEAYLRAKRLGAPAAELEPLKAKADAGRRYFEVMSQKKIVNW